MPHALPFFQPLCASEVEAGNAFLALVAGGDCSTIALIKEKNDAVSQD